MSQPSTHWVPARFRCLSDDQIGTIQHRLIDLDERAVDVAADYKISHATVYRVKNAVPAELVHFDELGLRRYRTPKRKRSKQRRAV